MSSASPSGQGVGAIPCHCIIAHPAKPKFLVIRHSDRWSPPTLQVPDEGTLMYKPALINEGMMQKYGLRTSVLRIVVEARNYAQVELELHASSPRSMQAVWVGLEEYRKFRGSDGGEEDFLEQWLKNRERRPDPAERAPWEKPGWYREASEWFADRLIELGIQARGSVQQFKAGWPTSCLLRASTLQGQMFFKAALDKRPRESQITAFLSQHWPDLVPEPLAVDEDRNWMLMRDFQMKTEHRPPRNTYPEFAATLARFQLEASARLDDWREMGCPLMDQDYLANEEGRLEASLERAAVLLGSGPSPWSREDLDHLGEAVAALGDASRLLTDFPIPDSLSHLDFRPDNFFLENDKCRIIDWGDVAISHPFMAICHTLDYFERREKEKSNQAEDERTDEALRNQIAAAYLAEFEALLPRDRIDKAFELTRTIFPLFRFLHLTGKAGSIESGTPQWNNLNSLLRKAARTLAETQS